MSTDDGGGIHEEILHVTACGRWIRLDTTLCGKVLIRIRLSLQAGAVEPVSGNVCMCDIFQAIIDGRMGHGTVRHQACGTDFQEKIWNAVCLVPYGRTASYGQIVRMAGCGSPRAVGQALKANPLPLLIPCHRVVGASGGLTGFSSGVEIKKILLEHEYENSSSQ